jgi:hypothetical protein
LEAAEHATLPDDSGDLAEAVKDETVQVSANSTPEPAEIDSDQETL